MKLFIAIFAHTIFWTGLFLIVYVHILNPIILICIGIFQKLFGSSSKQFVYREDNELPNVTLLIAAYNEEAVIEAKLMNSLELNYPRDKMEILVFSDCSTDQTDTIVKNYLRHGVILNRFNNRKGKTECQNLSIKKASGEIIVFSDAPSLYNKDAIKFLVAPFFDPEVGGVVGRVVFQTSQCNTEAVAVQESLHIRFLQWIKSLESNVSMPVGASGSIFAIRKNLLNPIPANVADDLIRPLEVIRQGYRLIYQPQAVATEFFCEQYEDIQRKKIRSARRAIVSLKMERELLNPFKYGIFSVQFLTKTLLRRLLFPSYVMFFLGALLLYFIGKGSFYFIMILGLLSFAFGGFLGGIQTPPKILQKQVIRYPCTLIYYYMITMYSAFKGIILGLCGSEIVTWNPARKDNS